MPNGHGYPGVMAAHRTPHGCMTAVTGVLSALSGWTQSLAAVTLPLLQGHSALPAPDSGTVMQKVLPCQVRQRSGVSSERPALPSLRSPERLTGTNSPALELLESHPAPSPAGPSRGRNGFPRIHTIPRVWQTRTRELADTDTSVASSRPGGLC